MAKAIPQLDAADALAGTEPVWVDQSGPKRTTVQNIADLGSGLGAGTITGSIVRWDGANWVEATKVKVTDGSLDLGVFSTTDGGILTLYGTSANVAAILKCTNGNLHIDADGTSAMYLNFYSGTSGIKFGDGASGSNADVTAAGVFTWAGGGSANANTAFGWGDHAGNYQPTDNPEFTTTIKVTAGSPKYRWEETGEGANEKVWDIRAAQSDLKFQTRADDYTAGVNYMTVVRGTGTAVASIDIDTALNVSGAVTGSNLAISDWNTAFGWGNHASGGYAPLASPNFTGFTSFGGDTIGGMESVTGNYGSVQCDGLEGSSGGWAGYSINGRVVFMHDNSTATGIYDDVNNQWMFYGILGAETKMYYGGTEKFRTSSVGVSVTGRILADSLGVPSHVSTGYVGNKITVSSSTPTSPTQGDIWFDTS